MKITRFNKDRDSTLAAELIDIELLDGTRFRITEKLGLLGVHELDGNTIIISPGCANEITISSEDRP